MFDQGFVRKNRFGDGGGVLLRCVSSFKAFQVFLAPQHRRHKQQPSAAASQIFVSDVNSWNQEMHSGHVTLSYKCSYSHMRKESHSERILENTVYAQPAIVNI